MIELVKGDICQIEVDAIVNAANSRLIGGGGVDGAIHRQGGPMIMRECDKIRREKGGCPTGEAVATSAGKLPARLVIHTVGPVWQGGDKGEPELLFSAYTSSLRLASHHVLRSISFPNISTGVYGFPRKLAAQISIRAVKEFVANNTMPERIVFVCYDDDNYSIYQDILS